MKKNYVYLAVLLIATVALTLFLSSLYKRETLENSYLYEKLNKITATEFEEYMLEHPDTIIYIANKNDLDNNKFEKKFENKLEKLNLLENIIYIEKEEVTSSLEKELKEKYSYKYSEEKIPTIIIISDGQFIESAVVNENSDVNTIVDYGVFE